MKKAILLILILVLPYSINAKIKVFLDNEDLQEYKNTLGKWIRVFNKNELTSLSKTFSTDINAILKINSISKNPSFPKYYFIPYSNEYIESLKNKNIGRSYLSTTDDEFIWPITDPKKISSVTGFRNKKFHPGLDVPAEKDMPIVASMEGIVEYSGYTSDDGYGNVVIIKHKNNFYTRYAHNTVNFVKKGDFIKKGQIIGLVGSTGHSTGNHVHFELRCNNVPMDPLDFLPAKENLDIVFTLKNWK